MRSVLLRCFLLSFLFTSSLSGVLAQKASTASVTNVQIQQIDKQIKITYDISNLSKNDSVYIQVQSKSKGDLRVKSVRGDLGKGVRSGLGKTIYWDFSKDGAYLEDEIEAIVNVKLASLKASGGPANALLSVLVPGLGNIMVQPNRKIGFRPLITVAYSGLLAFGFIQRGRAKEQYQLYQSQTLESQAEPYYTQANQLRHQYILATRAAAAILISDVLYTAIKGSHNRKKANQITVNFQGKTPMIGVRWTL